MGSPVVRIDPDLRELIPGFLDNRRRDAEALLDAVHRGDLETIARLGHSLKGVGGGFGFDEVSALGSAIEAAGREGRLDEVERLSRRLRSYLDEVQIVFY